MRRTFWLAVLAVSVWPGLAIAEGPRVSEIRKILFLGNSITRHAPAPHLDWHDDWGMAASAQEKDYVHLVAAGVARRAGREPEILVRNIAEFERDYATYDVAGKMKDAFAFDADLVVLAIGENVPDLATPEAGARFQAAVKKVLDGIRAGGRRPAIIVRGSFWPSDTKDARLRAAADEADATFVDIRDIGRDPANEARSERPFKNDGVAAHPGDRGMKAIADAILAALDRIEGNQAIR